MWIGSYNSFYLYLYLALEKKTYSKLQGWRKIFCAPRPGYRYPMTRPAFVIQTALHANQNQRRMMKQRSPEEAEKSAYGSWALELKWLERRGDVTRSIMRSSLLPSTGARRFWVNRILLRLVAFFLPRFLPLRLACLVSIEIGAFFLPLVCEWTRERASERAWNVPLYSGMKSRGACGFLLELEKRRWIAKVDSCLISASLSRTWCIFELDIRVFFLGGCFYLEKLKMGKGQKGLLAQSCCWVARHDRSLSCIGNN